MPAMKKNAECVGFEQVFSKLVKEIGSPNDFELPEWLNKWKPTCSFIRRNVYLTKKIKRRDDGIFCSCSSTPGSSGICGRDCLCRAGLTILARAPQVKIGRNPLAC